MSERNSTALPKPSKPYLEFPLFLPAAGVSAKKFRGKLEYFGPWSDPDTTQPKYLRRIDGNRNFFALSHSIVGTRGTTWRAITASG